MFGALHRAFGVIPKGNVRILHEKFDSEVKKIGLSTEKLILNEVAGQLFTYCFNIFEGVGYRFVQ